MFKALLLFVFASAMACSPSSSLDVINLDAPAPSDASVGNDVSSVDVVALDSQVFDANAPDTSTLDVALPDASAPDANTPDASAPDANAPDANAPDVAPPNRDFFFNRAVCAGNNVATPQGVGSVEEGLIEVSGVVPSGINPGVLWMHADSGNVPLINAVTHDAQTLARYRPQLVTAEDLEDIAVATCFFDDDASCLYVADMGNNSGTRSDMGVIVFREPTVDAQAGFVGNVSIFDAQRLSLHYPNNEGIDSEALLVDPDGSAIYLIEKIDAANARVFVARAPFVGDDIELSLLTTFRSPGLAIRLGRSITAADMHPSKERMLLRTYSGVFEYRFGAGQFIENLSELSARTVTFGPFSEPQGESLSYDESGAGLWSISEDASGTVGQPLHFYRCETP